MGKCCRHYCQNVFPYAGNRETQQLNALEEHDNHFKELNQNLERLMNLSPEALPIDITVDSLVDFDENILNTEP